MVALVYLAVACLAFLPGIVSPADWTGTEARRLQIALEMAQHGDWLVPTLGHEPNLTKPPLHYWVLAAIARWLGTEIWLMRVPGPLVFGALACLTHSLLRRSHGTATAWCAGLGVLLSPLVIAQVPRAEIDPLFAGVSTAAILLLARGAAFGSRAWVIAGGFVGGLAILVKGPPFFMLLAGTIAVWLRRRGTRGLAPALAAMAVPPLAYYLLLVRELDGAAVLVDVAANESVARMSQFTWSNVLDTPLHFVRAFAATLPFGLLSFFEYRGERRAEPDDAEAFVRMLAAPFFATVLVLVFFPARPSRYLLPAIPLFFIAVSPSVAAFARLPDLHPRAHRVVLGAGLLGAVGLCASPFLPPPTGVRTALGFVALAALPALVTTGRRAVVAMLLLPALAAWTFVAAFADHRALGREPYARAGVALRSALEAHGAHDLATLLHVPSAVLLHADVLPPGDEFARREPSSKWLLLEEDARPQEAWAHAATATLPPPAYTTRVRLQLPRLALLLMERH